MLNFLIRHSSRLSVRCGLIVLAIFLGSLIAGTQMPARFRGFTRALVEITVLKDGHGAALFLIIKQNLLVLGSEWAGFFTAGFTSILQVAWNGFQLGLLVRHYDFRTLTALVLPHALLEFPALLIGATISLWLVLKTIKDAMKCEFHLIQHLRRVIPFASLCVGLILLAALIEVYLTPIIGAYTIGIR